ncbi:MAG: hypothetical protein QM766_13090 [Burkholderiaceae bacterium]
MTDQQAMALDEPRIDIRGTEPARRSTASTRPGSAVGRLIDKGFWIFRRSEALGWLLALALNVSAAGWLGVAIWAVIFAVSIIIETAAEPIEA